MVYLNFNNAAIWAEPPTIHRNPVGSNYNQLHRKPALEFSPLLT